jgi:hypothetical protein
MLLTESSLPPRSARLTPSLEKVSPTPCRAPPLPNWPETRLLTPSWALSMGSTPVTLVWSRVSVDEDYSKHLSSIL